MCGEPGRPGTTEGCGAFTCSAGQYCVTGFPAECSNGCTSDSNCGGSEHCVRCGNAAVGTCESCASTNDSCVKPDATIATCVRDSFVDQTCSLPDMMGRPRPPVGYQCPDDMTVPSDPSCVHADLSIDWCCAH